METRARYSLIGGFVLLAAIAIFSTVYWLQNVGGIGPRQLVRVRYAGTVSGLLKGSAVLFNGVRVGEVVRIDLDTSAPKDIVVTVAVDPAIPLRSDTKASIDFQGLSGAPVVTLSGGEIASPALVRAGTLPPMLVADANAGQSVMSAARAAIQHVDAVVQANAEPLHNLIVSIEKFSAALARNSDRIDGILTGIEKFTGGGKGPARIIDLKPVTVGAPQGSLPPGQMQVAEPSMLNALDQPRIFVRSANGDIPALAQVQWPDALGRVVQARVVQSLENSGYLKVLSRPLDGSAPDYQLLLDIRTFQLRTGTKPVVEIEYGAKLIGEGGKIIGARILTGTASVSSLEPEPADEAFNAVFGETLKELVSWCLSTLSSSGAKPAAPAAPTRPLSP